MSVANTMYGTRAAGVELPDLPTRPLRGGAPTLDFANTASTGPADRDDLAPGYANALAWLLHAGLLDEPEATALLRRARRNAKDAAMVRRRLVALRDAVRAAVVALSRGDPPAADHLAIINSEHLEAERHGRFVAENRRLAWAFDASTDLDRVNWPLAREAVRFLTEADLSRVRACASSTCDALFLDTTRNGSRRFCDPATCGGASRVRRFRERHRDQGTP